MIEKIKVAPRPLTEYELSQYPGQTHARLANPFRNGVQIKIEGEYVRANSFWHRRIKAGDAVIVSDTPKPSKKKHPPTKEPQA